MKQSGILVHKVALAAIALILILWVPRLMAQENATITGTITDSSGALVPNAALVLTNAETGESRSTTSNSTGIYIFTALRIGHYSLSASAQGFQTFGQQGIVLNVSDTVKIDIKFKVGSANQSVTVQANALHLQAETGEVSDLISGAQLTQLETNGRNIISLATLGMGVSSLLPDFNAISGEGSNFNLEFEGSRSTHNLWLLDGAEVDDRGAGGVINVMPAPDALAEFKVLDSNYSPDYGIASGGTIAMVLKSGSRDFHGGLWEFNRNDAFDANNYISKQNKLPAPELRLNIFGGDLGGPVWMPHIYNGRQKTFFFVSEEWRRLVQGNSPTVAQDIDPSDIPTAGQPLLYTPPVNGITPLVPSTGDPNQLALYAQDSLTPGQPFPNNTIPANLIDPNAVLFMHTGGIPAPNTTNDEYVVDNPYPTYVHEDIVRVDHAINSKFQLMGHFVHDYMAQYEPVPGTNTFSTVEGVRTIPSYSAMIKLTQIFTSSLLNQTAFSFSRNRNGWDFAPGALYREPPGWSATSLFPTNNPLNKLPSITIGAPYQIAYSATFAPYHNAGQSSQIRDDLSWTRGKHQMTFGGGLLHYTKLQMFQTQSQPSYTFTTGYSGDSYVNFLLGLATTYSQLQAQSTFYTISNTASVYGNDSWHVIPRLTLNLGVRYDALPHTYGRYNQFANFIPSDYNPADAPEFDSVGSMNTNGPGFSTPNGFTTPSYLNGIRLAGVDGFPRGLVRNYWGTVQPRVGFAADISGDGKTVLRGGSGIFFERIEGQDLYNASTNAPFDYYPSLSNVYFSNPLISNINGQTATAPYFPLTIISLDYNYHVPATLQSSLGVQRQINSKIIGVIQYVGSSSWHQSDIRDINTLPLDSTEREAVAQGTYNGNLVRQYPGYGTIYQQETDTNNNYNSLQAGLRTEDWRHLQLQLAYTYSHEIEIGSTDLFIASDPFDLNYDRGSGAFDRRHIFNANYIYNLPLFTHAGNGFVHQALGGWQLSGIVVAESGVPNRPTYAPDILGLDGAVGNRPNLVGKVTGPKTQKQYFNTKAFAAPIAPWNGGPGFGDAGKDAINGPGRLNFNMGLFKSFPFTSHGEPRFEFRLESFNTFNHTQFMTLSTSYTASTFGQVTAVQDPRVLQLSGKLLF